MKSKLLVTALISAASVLVPARAAMRADPTDLAGADRYPAVQADTGARCDSQNASEANTFVLAGMALMGLGATLKKRNKSS